jgi:hypothetical protein
VRCFVGQISRTLFLTRYSPPSLPDGSGCSIRVIRLSGFRQQVSHLLPKYTKSGYGTVLTAACARQGCSATYYYCYYYYFLNVTLFEQWNNVPLRIKAILTV